MRTLKSGEIKFKPSVMKAVEWMTQDPLPMRSMRKQTNVKVFMGAGWSKGTVVNWSLSGITVYLAREKRTVTVRDNRNLKEDTK